MDLELKGPHTCNGGNVAMGHSANASLPTAGTLEKININLGSIPQHKFESPI